MSIKLTILGCHSATPRKDAHPTSQVLDINERKFLIDCGEGTQVLLRIHKVQFSKIKHIFISHLHGDHFYGLIGLISTFGLHNRENDLHIYGPKGIKEVIVLQLKLAKAWTKYQLIFHELTSEKSELIFEDKKVEVYTIPLDHRVYTNGYLFKEKTSERKLNIDSIKQNKEIEICDYHNLKKGKDFVSEDGKTIIPNEKLTFPPSKALSYAFCSDTAYKPDIVPIIKNVDLLYHESTFLEDKIHLTERTKHATAKQAASIATQANAKHLVLGHYSSRYDSIELFKDEAETAFDKTITLAVSGKEIEIK
jgi:ribonuclease Z